MADIKFLIDADYENNIFKQHAPKNVYNLESFDGIFKATKSDLTLWKSRCVYIGTLKLKFWIIGLQYKKIIPNAAAVYAVCILLICEYLL